MTSNQKETGYTMADFQVKFSKADILLFDEIIARKLRQNANLNKRSCTEVSSDDDKTLKRFCQMNKNSTFEIIFNDDKKENFFGNMKTQPGTVTYSNKHFQNIPRINKNETLSSAVKKCEASDKWRNNQMHCENSLLFSENNVLKNKNSNIAQKNLPASRATSSKPNSENKNANFQPGYSKAITSAPIKSELLQSPYSFVNNDSQSNVHQVNCSSLLKDATYLNNSVLKCNTLNIPNVNMSLAPHWGKKLSVIKNKKVVNTSVLSTKGLSSNTFEKVEAVSSSFQDPTNENISYYIVVDTNVLISNLGCIDKIKNSPIEKCGPPHIFIPLVVYQELNHLQKHMKINKSAQKAVKYIKRMIESKHPQIHLQTQQEAKDWVQPYSGCNDDCILECCIQFIERMPSKKVILLTNDINLLTKALILEIQGYDFDSFMKFLNVNYKVLKSKKKRKNKKDRKFQSSASSSLTRSELSSETLPEEIKLVMMKAEQKLSNILKLFLEKEMFKTHGDSWKILNISTLFLKDTLDAIVKYWQVAFALNFTSKDKRNFEILKKFVNRPKGFLFEKEESIQILTSVEDVFFCIKRRWQDLNPPIEDIQSMRSFLNVKFPNNYLKKVRA